MKLLDKARQLLKQWRLACREKAKRPKPGRRTSDQPGFVMKCACGWHCNRYETAMPIMCPVCIAEQRKEFKPSEKTPEFEPAKTKAFFVTELFFSRIPG